MFKSFALAATTTETGMGAGPGLSAAQTSLFVIVPIAMFAIIALLSWASTANRNKKKLPVDQID